MPFFRRIEELQNDLLSSSQQIAKLNESLEEQQLVQKTEKDELVHKFEDQLKSVQSQLEEMVSEHLLLLSLLLCCCDLDGVRLCCP